MQLFDIYFFSFLIREDDAQINPMETILTENSTQVNVA